jgi:ATP/maltotriose-dependent transcriptional regulator MalT
VLEGQTGQVREFLLETSVLERLSQELCDAVTGRANGQAMLEQVERAGLFLMPLDDVHSWWRYHQLFGDLLRARLQQERPARVAALHRAAAAWHEERDLADEAVQHAMAAGDPAWAARLIERYSTRSSSRARERRFNGGSRPCPQAGPLPPAAGPGPTPDGAGWRSHGSGRHCARCRRTGVR